MHLFKTTAGPVLRTNGQSFLISDNWDKLINQSDLHSHLKQIVKDAALLKEGEAEDYITTGLMPPIGNQEVWAAGVTYLRSRDARMDESKDSGAADCYQRVYDAERPELFFK